MEKKREPGGSVKRSSDKYASCNFCKNDKSLFEITGRSLIVTICCDCIANLATKSGHLSATLQGFRLYAHDEFGENVSDYMIQSFLKSTNDL